MKSVRYDRLFSRGERCVIIAVDHCLFDGPIPGMVDLRETVSKISSSVDAILLSPGMLPYCREALNFKGSPMAVGRLNWSTTYCFKWKYTAAATVPVFRPAEALRLGADVALISLTLQSGSEATDARNVGVFRDLCAEAQSLGMPVVGEYFPNEAEALNADELHAQVLVGARIIAELGAEVIKTFYTKEFKAVTSSCPVPVLGLGASKLPTQLEALELAAREVEDGAGGVVFGRNAIQVPNPAAFQEALCDVVKRGMMPGEAAQRHGLSG